MKLLSINELEHYSGIKAHTIRTWEKRYGLLTPQRSGSNLRLYTIDDLQLLLNISLLIKNGGRISQLARWNPEEIAKKTQGLFEESDRMQMAIHQLIFYKLTADIENLEDLLDSCVNCWGIHKTIEEVIVPFLRKTGLLSYKDSSCETHFAITAVRRKIIFGMETVQPTSFSHHTALLFLPKGEHYDIVLLYLAYKLKNSGIRVLYLGTNVSLGYLKEIITEKAPEYVYTHIPEGQNAKLLQFLTSLSSELPCSLFYVVAPEPIETEEQSNLHYLPLDEATGKWTQE